MNTQARALGTIRGWRFLLITLAALCTMAVTASLGRWQLSRAAQKEAIQQAMDERLAAPVLSAADFVAGQKDKLSQEGGYKSGPLLHRQVQLTGHWLADQTIYLDNRQMQGRPGFYVLTPLKLNDGAGSLVMVQRGWIPRHIEDRTRIAPFETPAGEVHIQGRVAAEPSRLYELGPSGKDARDSRIRQNLGLSDYGAETHLGFLPLTVVQTGASGEGLLREWPAIDSGVSKHYGYAFQWFGLCSLVAILYVWFQLIRRFLRPRSQPRA